MADQDIEAYLRSLKTSDRVRAAAWDAIYAVGDDAQAEQVLRQLTLPDEAKAAIWDARSRVKATTAADVPQDAPEGSAVGRFIGGAAEMLNPIAAVKGIASAVRHPIDTAGAIVDAHSEQFGKAKDAFGEGRYSEAAGHGLAGVLPIIGPVAANIGEQIGAGDVAGGVGAGAGLITGAALAGPAARGVGKVVQPVAAKAGEALYQSALKPTKAVLKDVRTPAGAGPDAARQTLVQTGLREGIPVSARGAKKAETLIDSLNTEVETRIAAATARGATVDAAAVEQTIAGVAKDFTNQINAQPDLAAIAKVRKNFAANPNASRTVQGPAGTATIPQDIPIDVAQQMKRGTYQGLRGKYGVERGATIEAEKAGARGLREGIEQADPSVAGLNAREGAVIPLEEAIADAMRRRGNYGIFGLTPIVASIPAITHGNVWPLLASLADRAPGVISRGGIWINRVGQTSGRAANVAGKATVVGTTNPSESRTRTRGRGQLQPLPAQ